MGKKVVLRRSLLDNIKLVIGCIIFVAVGIFIYGEARFWGIACILFFGGGGLAYLIFMSWRPIAVISDKGISVSHGLGEHHVPWGNVDRFEEVTQTVSQGVKINYIGIFASDMEDTGWTGEISLKIAKSVTAWEEFPALLIPTSYRSTKPEYVMRILQEFHHEYYQKINAGIGY